MNARTAHRRRSYLLAALLLPVGCATAPWLSLSGLGLRVSSEPDADCAPRSTAQAMVEGVQCVRPAGDVGANCSADQQCEGVCELDTDTAPGRPASGHCSATVQAKPGGP